MPQVADGGYVSLQNGAMASNSVYNSTTEPAGHKSVFDSMKRVFGNAIGNGELADHDGPLINGAAGKVGPVIAGAR